MRLSQFSSSLAVTLNITFHQPTTSRKAQDSGIFMFSMSFPKQQIKEDYINITCMRCYKLNHITNNCSMPKDFKICSECGEEGHKYNDYNNNYKKCINVAETIERLPIDIQPTYNSAAKQSVPSMPNMIRLKYG